MNFAILGCGLIGQKRRRALAASGRHRLVAAADLDPARAAAMGAEIATTDPLEAIGHRDVQAVIIATTNDALAPLTRAALKAAKPVLVEKPAALRAEELQPLLPLAGATGVQVGFNLRFHPALRKANELVSQGALGPLLFVRGRYGHGGRPGYDREWRADPKRAGGGELIDQGVHLIDLARWFLGDFPVVDGHTATYFWDMPVDDNAFLSLRTAAGQTAWLQASCTEWKNLFSFEIYGRDGKLAIDGLGGSYGLERLAFYRMTPEMGPPETTIWEFPREDRSLEMEFNAFVGAIESGLPPSPNLSDALSTLRIVETIYLRTS